MMMILMMNIYSFWWWRFWWWWLWWLYPGTEGSTESNDYWDILFNQMLFRGSRFNCHNQSGAPCELPSSVLSLRQCHLPQPHLPLYLLFLLRRSWQLSVVVHGQIHTCHQPLICKLFGVLTRATGTTGWGSLSSGFCWWGSLFSACSWWRTIFAALWCGSLFSAFGWWGHLFFCFWQVSIPFSAWLVTIPFLYLCEYLSVYKHVHTCANTYVCTSVFSYVHIWI